MNPSFIKTDAGRSLYLPAEHRDCTVRALAIACAMPYPAAHNALAQLGRPFARGFDLGPVHEKLGLTMRPELSSRRFSKVLPHLGIGRFLVLTRSHVFAVVHGTIYDQSLPRATAGIRMVYEVEIPLWLGRLVISPGPDLTEKRTYSILPSLCTD